MSQAGRWTKSLGWSVVVTAVFLSACDAHVKKFTVEPRHICAGEPVQIEWTVQGSGRVTVTPPNDRLPNGPVDDEGSAVIAPRATTMVALHVTRWLGHPDGAEQEVVVTGEAKRETLMASLADSTTTPSCGEGRVQATVHARRFSPNVKVSTVGSHAGDNRTYVVQHGGHSATVKPGEVMTEFQDTPLAGDWTLSAPVDPGQTCESVPAALVIDVNTQCLAGGAP